MHILNRCNVQGLGSYLRRRSLDTMLHIKVRDASAPGMRSHSEQRGIGRLDVASQLE